MANDDDFDVLTMYIEEDGDDSAAAAAKEEAKQKRRQEFQQRGKPPPPPLSPKEMRRRQVNREMHDKLWEFDPKLGCGYYTRIWFVDFTNFDIDEETQHGPMRFTDSPIKEGHWLEESLNIINVKIMSSDVGFPINVYGTVVIRDFLDLNCNYIFRRDRDNCQLMKFQGDSLILSGPSRGVLFRDAFLEIDLKIRGEGEEMHDKKLNKTYDHVVGSKIKNVVEKFTYSSWLSEVELVFAHVKKALEGTVEIKILSGPESFVGKITACTTDIPDDNQMLLYQYDSNASVGGAVMAGSDTGRTIQLFRRVVVVSADQMLVFRIWDDSSCIPPPCISSFTPQIKGSNWDLVPCGPYKLQVKVVWSTL